MLFSCYRKDEAHDPDVYCAAVAATLADFSRKVVDYVTDPRTGMPSTNRFLPNIAEIREACVRETGRQQLHAKPRRAVKFDPTPLGPEADLFVGIGMPRYELMSEMLAKEPNRGRREAGGIWIPHRWYEQGRTAQTEQQRLENSRLYFERECRAEGIDPAGEVSPSLLKTLGRMPMRPQTDREGGQ